MRQGEEKLGFIVDYHIRNLHLLLQPHQLKKQQCCAIQIRIQQFPDDWIFTGTIAAKYKQIGNAVPVGLAKAIGQAIIATADKTSTIQTKRFRGTSVHNKIKNAMKLGGSDGTD